MGRDSRGIPNNPASVRMDAAEEQFYAVMHHLATVLWMKGATVEALAALSAVVEWVGQEAEDTGPRPPTC
jgi:hypothetical protein